MTLGVLLAGFAGLGDQDHQSAMYLPAFLDHPGFGIVAVTGDRRAADTAAELGVPYLPGLSDALAHPGVDVVSAAVAPELRAETVIAAMAAGKAVLADKPLAGDLADAEAIVAAQRATGAVLLVAHHLRLHPELQAAATAVAAGEPGPLRSVAADFFVAGGSHPPSGELLNFGGYPVDVVRALTGRPVERVYAAAGRPWHDGGGEDLVALALEHTGGMTSTIALGRTSEQPGIRPAGVAVHRYRIRGDAGTLTVEAAPGPDTVRLLVDRLHRAVAHGVEVPIDAAAGLHALRVIDAARRSIAAGRAVVLPDPS